jgi:xanthine dehydrogenase accessory factor
VIAGAATAVLPSPHRLALAWLHDGRRVAAATLVEAVGSAPLDAGAAMLVDDQDHIEGSVTGGCVEAALVYEARDVLGGGAARVTTYGISDGDAFAVGLMCGGTVRVLVHELGERQRPVLSALVAALDAGVPAVLATLIDGPAAGGMLAVIGDGADAATRTVGRLGGAPRLDAAVARDALGLLGDGRSALRRYGAEGEVLGDAVRVRLEVFAPPPQMVIFGAIDFAAALAQAARALGFEITICDPRSAFAGSPRFARHAEVVVAWPDACLPPGSLNPSDAVLVFTHDPRLDVPALQAALASGAGYIGALGSRRTHHERCDRLRAAGASAGDLARIQSPCGLDIGARTPAETAVSILAEVIARRSGRGGRPLGETSGPIHDRRLGVSAEDSGHVADDQ